MAKQKSSNQKFMRHAGTVQGLADLSSRRGFSLVVEKKAEVEPFAENRPEEDAASRVSTIAAS
ncbi:MAG: hypothetical protein ABR861_12130 [Terriglobales bacterium]|jgi:hypothetical protein